MKKLTVILLSFILIISLAACNNNQEESYSLALTLYLEKNYEEAYEIFNELGDYKDSLKYSDELLDKINSIVTPADNITSETPNGDETENSNDLTPENKDEDNFATYLLDDGTLEIIKYLGDETIVLVPNQIEGKTVTEVGDSAFSNLHIEEITFPESIREMGVNIFKNTPTLRKIILLSPQPFPMKSLALDMRQIDSDTYLKIFVLPDVYDIYELLKSEEVFEMFYDPIIGYQPELYNEYVTNTLGYDISIANGGGKLFL